MSAGRDRRALPRRAYGLVRGSIVAPVPLYTAGLLLAGAALSIVVSLRVDWTRTVAWGALPFVGALLIVAAMLLVRFQYRSQVMAIDLFETVLAAALFVFPAHAVVLTVAAALTFVELRHHNALNKLVFNVAQWSAAAAAGALVLGALRAGSEPDARNLGALMAAMSAVALVNVFAFSFVVKLAERKPMRAVTRRLAPAILLGWIVNTAFGIAFVVALDWNLAALLIFAVLLGLLHGVHRSYAAVMADRARIGGMHRATRALVQGRSTADALMAFVEGVRSCFEASRALLAIDRDDGRLVIDSGGSAGVDPVAAVLLSSPNERRHGDQADPTLRLALGEAGLREALAVPVIVGSRAGVLAVFDRSGARGFEDDELAVLEALAGEAAVALERAALHDQVEHERRKLREIIEHTSDGIFTVTPGGAVASWNTAMERLTGIPALEVIDRPLALDVRDRRGKRVAIADWTRAQLPVELILPRGEGDRRSLACGYTRLTDRAGEPRLLIVVARDLTAEVEVSRVRSELTESVANISHELRSPLGPIIGWAETLARIGDRLPPDEHAEGIRSILRHSRRLDRLMGDLLEAAKLERGMEPREMVEVDATEVARQIVDGLRLVEADRTITVTADADCVVRGDEAWLDRILANLLSNAIKYSPTGQPVDVVIRRTARAVEVMISDRGAGIPEEDRERVFGRYERLFDELTRTSGGTGLGLYLSRRLARAMGGSLVVRDREGGGSTFVLTMPPAGGAVRPDETATTHNATTHNATTHTATPHDGGR
ncbi:MAG TPA: ATP-binding protein [Actinomycetota bacterium]